MQRQVLLLIIFSHEESIIDLEMINKNTPIDIRTLQRDMNDLSMAGFLDVRFDKGEKRYVGEVYIPNHLPDIDARKRKHFEDILHYEKMIFAMGNCLERDFIEDVLFEMDLFESLHKDWSEECGLSEFEPEYSGMALDPNLSVSSF